MYLIKYNYCSLLLIWQVVRKGYQANIFFWFMEIDREHILICCSFFFQLLIIFMNSRELYHNAIVLNIKLFLFHVDIIMLSALKIFFFFAWKLSIVEIVKCFQKICKIWTTHWQKFKSMLSCSRPFLLCNKLAFLCNISYWILFSWQFLYVHVGVIYVVFVLSI